MKFINIIDPIFSKNNLGKSISKHNYFRLKRAFTYQMKKLDGIYAKVQEQGPEYLFNSLLNIFKSTLECNSVLPILSLKFPVLVAVGKENSARH